MRRRTTEEIVDILVVRMGTCEVRLDKLDSAAAETRNLVIGLGIDTTEETGRLDAHVTALEDAGRASEGEPEGSWHSVFGVWEPPNPAARHEHALRKAAEAERDALHQKLAVLRGAVEWALKFYPDPPTGNPIKQRLADALATTSEEREA